VSRIKASDELANKNKRQCSEYNELVIQQNITKETLQLVKKGVDFHLSK
jgi:hypothetical protein